MGESAGKTISLAAASLRSSAIELLGSGFGSASIDEIFEAIAEFFRVAARVSLKIDIKPVPLRDVKGSGILPKKARGWFFCRNRARITASAVQRGRLSMSSFFASHAECSAVFLDRETPCPTLLLTQDESDAERVYAGVATV